MKKEVSIEKKLFPKSDRLIMKNGTLTAQLIDYELDPIKCTYNGDDCVILKTKPYSYITLSVENLERMLFFIEEAESYDFQID